jgi:hypothetical protein
MHFSFLLAVEREFRFCGAAAAVHGRPGARACAGQHPACNGKILEKASADEYLSTLTAVKAVKNGVRANGKGSGESCRQ